MIPRSSVADGKTDEWSPWSTCSVSCGEGWQSRTRLCATTSFTTQCTGPLRENRSCNNTAVCTGECTVLPLVLPPQHSSGEKNSKCFQENASDISLISWSKNFLSVKYFSLCCTWDEEQKHLKVAFAREEMFQSDQINGLYDNCYTSLMSKNGIGMEFWLMKLLPV